MTGAARPVFPFTALVAQDGMKRALVLNAINPRIGGVLIRGEKGTAKSTAVRALAGLLPEVEAIAGCAYACDPAAAESWCDDCRARASVRGHGAGSSPGRLPSPGPSPTRGEGRRTEAAGPAASSPLPLGEGGGEGRWTPQAAPLPGTSAADF